jgi:SAM-dependent methyltransferase
MDRAGTAYWDALWKGQPIPLPVDPDDQRLGNTVDSRFHQLFEAEFKALPPGSHVLEVGCARSKWLPYFATRYGFAVSGLDYSVEGCEQARAILDRAGVEGTVVYGDMFDPPDDLVGRFDAVVSFGLVEHFADTAAAQAALARFLVDDGILVTVIPNMGRSVVGWLQKVLDRRVYDVHIPLDRRRLLQATRDAGLHVSSCAYFMAWNWSVINISDWRDLTRLRLAGRVQSGASKALWWLERRGLTVSPNRLTSPYIVAVARMHSATRPPGSSVPGPVNPDAAAPG